MLKNKLTIDSAKKVGLEILESFSPLKEELSWVVISSTIINILALATPLVMLQVFDRIVAKGSMDTLALIMLGATIAIAMESIMKVVRAHLSAWIAARFEHKAMLGTVSRMLSMPLHKFELSGAGSHNDHFKAIQSLKSFYSGQTFQHMLDIPFTLLYILVMAFISPWIALLLVVGYTLFSFFVWRSVHDHNKLVKDKNMSDLRRTNFLNETLSNIHTLKSMSMEALMLRRYERLQETSANVMKRLTIALDIAQGLGSVFSPLMSALVITLGAFLVVTGHLTTGELAACIMLGGRSLAPIQRLGGIWARHQQEQVMRDDLANLMQQSPLAENTHFSHEHIGSGQIRLDNVTYKFPTVDEPIFKDASLTINQGECVLIHGANGSGRTTMLQLLAGLIKPTSGQVTLDQKDLSELGSELLKKSIAYLPQRTQLFEGTLMENISVFDHNWSDSALDKAEALKIGGFVSKLPRGWDSPVGDAASEAMPPGYRQRIAIVRALAHNPEIILFDDATASMDSEGESFVLEYLKKAKGKVTLILVTQRPSFQKLADRVVTLKDGTLYEGMQDVSTPAERAAANLDGNLSPVGAELSRPLNASWERTHLAVQANFVKPNVLTHVFPALIKALGLKRSARDITESLPYFTESLDMAGFENAMAQLDYKAYHTDATLGSLDGRMLPCLFVTQAGDALVLLERKGDTFLVSRNVNEEPFKESNLRLMGTAYFFLKEDAPKSNNQKTTWVKKAIVRFQPLIVQAGISSIISGLIMVIGSLFMMAVYNEIIPSGSLTILGYLSLGVVASLWIGWRLMVHRAEILAYIAGRIEYLFGTTILQQILSLPPSMSERSAVSAQMSRISSFEAIRDLFTGPLASTLLESPATIVVLVALGIINPPSLIVFVIMVVIYAILTWILAPYSARCVSEVSATSTKRNEFIIEMIVKMRTVRETGATDKWLERFRKISAEATMASFKAEKLSQTLVGISYFVMMFAGLMIVTITVPLTLTQTLGPGALIASMFLMWRILGPIQTLFTNLTRIERVRSAVRQLEGLMTIQGERVQSATPSISRGLNGKLQFSRVSFRYSLNTDPALIGVDFTVNPGEVIAVTGPNGGGKSTMLKLIMGLYQPQAGSILIDDVDIRQLDPIELRRLVGYAPQDTQFFRATLSQNLRLARPDATDEEVRDALQKAGALEQVMDLPKGIEYRIGDNASEQLPASLRQKLTLARAYLTNAPIMLFDEPGAGLDTLGDKKFMEALAGFRGQKTIFFISHRPSHIRLADLVIVMDKGYIKAAGKPDDILKPLAPPPAPPVTTA